MKPGLLERLALATGFYRLRGVTERTGGVSVRTQHYFSWFGRGKMALPVGGGTPVHRGELSQYKIIKHIVRTALGEVLLAVTPGEVKVILKFLPLEKVLTKLKLSGISKKDRRQYALDALLRFEREYDVGRTLMHDRISRVLDTNLYQVFPGLKGYRKTAFKSDFTLELAAQALPVFIAIQFIPARPRSDECAPILGKRIREGMTEKQAVALFLPLLRTLVYAHRQGVYHRDLKPHNILISVNRRGEKELTLIDFGIAHSDLRWDKITRTGRMTGSLNYLAPHPYNSAAQRNVRASAQIDIYQMGIIILECITGLNPFQHLKGGVGYWRLLKEPQSIDVSGIRSLELRRILDKMLSPKRENNYRSMEEVVADFERLAKIMQEE